MRFFMVPVQDSARAADELNGFLSNHRILSVGRHFVADGINSAWAVCASYLHTPERPAGEKGVGRVDDREVLNDSDFQLFAQLRSLRKTLAEQEGVPAYALFTNEQLADMVRQKVTSMSALEQINGVGPARTKKYGAAFLKLLKGQVKSSPESAAPDGRGSMTPAIK